jgi:hypothetical protein
MAGFRQGAIVAPVSRAETSVVLNLGVAELAADAVC